MQNLATSKAVSRILLTGYGLLVLTNIAISRLPPPDELKIMNGKNDPELLANKTSSGQDSTKTFPAPAMIVKDSAANAPKLIRTYPMVSGADMTATYAGWAWFGNLIYPFAVFRSNADGFSYGMLFSVGNDRVKAAGSVLPSGLAVGGIYQPTENFAVGARWMPKSDQKTGKVILDAGFGAAGTLVNTEAALMQAAVDHTVSTNTMNVTGQVRFPAGGVELTFASQVGARFTDGMKTEIGSLAAGGELTVPTPAGEFRFSAGRTFARVAGAGGGTFGGPDGTRDVFSLEAVKIPGFSLAPLVEVIRTSGSVKDVVEVRAGLILKP